LFVGLFVGHFGFSVNPEVLHFIREFVYFCLYFSIGLQVGPVSSLRSKRRYATEYACSIVVLLGVAVTIGLYYY
jgi:putative transport protein